MPAAIPTPEALESALRRHVLDAWFPRCLDLEDGGFLCDFDRGWKPNGPQDKLLEFQARQTLLAADAAQAYPNDAGLRAATLHGFHYLRDVMWDREAGGWFHRLDRGGRPLEGSTKHIHGFAYAIEACASVYQATGEPSALALAQAGFAWMDRYARDRQWGGYFGFLHRDGTIIRDPGDCPWPTQVDTIGTEIGLKDANVHSDLLETFALLYPVWPDPTVGERLAEILALITDRMLVPATGALHIFVTADWRPIPHLTRAGYQCQTAFRLLLPRGLVGESAGLSDLALRLMRHSLRFHRDPAGGFIYGTPGTAPGALFGTSLAVRHKSWWVQTEALRTLLAASRLVEGEERAVLQEEFGAQWRYLERAFFDDRYGGIYASGLDGLSRRRQTLGVRFAPGAFTAKGDAWKDGSHEGRDFLYCVKALRTPEERVV